MRHLPALTLVAAVMLAGCATTEGPTSADVPAAAAADDTATPVLAFEGTDEVTWAKPVSSVRAGDVEITIECGEAVNHGLAIEGIDGGAELVACDAGGTATTTVTLDAGTYEYFCTVPGHRDAGMVGTLAVG